MNPDYLHGITLSVNKITKARNEVELYHSITESLINDFGFDRVTVRKVDWERCRLCLVSYDGFTDEINTFELPLSKETRGWDEVTPTAGTINLYEEDAVLAALRPAPEFSGLNKEMSASFHAVIPIKVRGRVVVVVGVDKNTNGEELTSQDKRVLDLFSEIAGGILENVLNKEALIRDELTGLFNRNYFMKRLNEELERAKRYDIPLSCCIFDIDDFKVINDTYGHLFGDHVLREIGRLTKGMVRGTDIVARYGGEEFVILFPQTRLDDAVVAVEHIRGTISTLVFLHNEKTVGVTATFGMSTNLPENTNNSSTLLHRADMALYEGKKQYRKNCIVTYSEYGYKAVNKEESLMRNSTNMNDTYESFPRIEWVRVSGIIHKTKFKKSLLAARIRLGCPRLRAQILIKAKDWKASLHHIGRGGSAMSLMGIGIILCLLIAFLFAARNGEDEGMFSISSMLSPVYSSHYPPSNLSCRVSMYDDRSLDDELEEISPFGKYIEITGANEQGQLTRAFAKGKKPGSRRGAYMQSKPTTASKRALVKEHLKRAFLLADL